MPIYWPHTDSKGILVIVSLTTLIKAMASSTGYTANSSVRVHSKSSPKVLYLGRPQIPTRPSPNSNFPSVEPYRNIEHLPKQCSRTESQRLVQTNPLGLPSYWRQWFGILSLKCISCLFRLRPIPYNCRCLLRRSPSLAIGSQVVQILLIELKYRHTRVRVWLCSAPATIVDQINISECTRAALYSWRWKKDVASF